MKVYIIKIQPVMFLYILFTVLLPFQEIDLSNSTENIEVVDAKYYTAVASTNNGYGHEHTVAIRIEANCVHTMKSCQILGVEVATDYGFKEVDYSTDPFGGDGYRFRHSVEGQEHVFEFSFKNPGWN